MRVVLFVLPALLAAQTFPLESVAVEGSELPQSLVLELSGLRPGAPIDRKGFDEAALKLQESGFFSSVQYRFAPGPKKGYALTLTLADQLPLADAAIDIPGVDEAAAWKGLTARYPAYDRKLPPTEAAQSFLARELEKQLGTVLRGQKIALRTEADIGTGKLLVLLQPETPPRIAAVTFTGNASVGSDLLTKALENVVAEGYTPRRFGAGVEFNLRPVYEERARYRVRFGIEPPVWADAGVSLQVAIAEGETYQLGKVDFEGESLPVEAMLAAGKLPVGQLANWKRIQQGIWDMEKVVKRTGYFAATATPERVLDDAAKRLDLRVKIAKGPLFRFGAITMEGLTPLLEKRAREIWRPKTGDPYDYQYPYEFLQAFSRVVDFSQFRKYDVVSQKGAGENTVDIRLVFVPR